MICKNCGKEILDNSKFCTQCGYRVEEAPAAQQPVAQEAPVVQQPVAQEAPVAQQPVVQEAPVVQQPVAQEAPVAQQPVAQEIPVTAVPPVAPMPQAVNEKPKKKHTGKIILGIVAAVVVVLAAVILLNLKALANFAVKTFSSPEKYYQWVEKQSVEDVSGLVSNVYGDIYDQIVNAFNTSGSAEIRLELGKDGRDMLSLAGLSGIDTSWFKDATLTVSAGTKDEAMQANYGLKLGKDQLISFDFIMDYSEEVAAYVAIPELSKTYLGMNLTQLADVDVDYMLQFKEFVELIGKIAPTDSQLKNLINKYGELALSHISDVKMKSGRSLRAEGITEKCTELTVTLDADTMQEIVEAVIEELAKDKEVEKIITKIFDGLYEADFEDIDIDIDTDMDAEEAYVAFLEALEYLADRTDYMFDSNFEFEMEVYVDGKGNIRGRSFDITDGWNKTEFSVIAPHKGSDFGYKASIIIDGDEVAIAGTGKESGKKVSGDFAIKYNGTGLCDIIIKDFNTEEIKKGYLNGNFVIKPSSGISRMIGMSYSSSILSDLEVTLDAKMSKKSSECTVSVKSGKDDWGTLSVKASKSSGKKITIPSGKKAIVMEDEEDLEDCLEDYWDTIDWDDFIDKLDETDLPSRFVDIIEEFAEMDVDDLVSGMSFGNKAPAAAIDTPLYDDYYWDSDYDW